jgi:hypothetical protein
MKSGGRLALTLAAEVACVFALNGIAQVRSQTTTTNGKASQRVKVERAEVVLVSGRDLVLRMEDGTIRHFANVPDSFKATVDDKQVGIYDLKAGMTLERTTTITTTPKLVKTMQTVKGRVWTVLPPSSVILTLDDGSNQRFEIPKGQKFNVEGKIVDTWGLKPGMIITATKVVEFTATEVEQRRKLTVALPPPEKLADVPILIAK